ncbi:TMEM175 family protein [Microbacterium sp. H1-D42]|uniref:TMEM175 family protein n=1 Tax=Microbacterium sp. H1-D42 TaxID=2925844 RepID=UPI001F533A7B|nr:TMEM175 family protein [Microbacterium sp. H1-D42]UNK70569.1 DUF1211 domain-containing protein [Microbacterium sp. H1-D42]
MTEAEPGAKSSLLEADRAKAFIDAVVAIAMTLLILPLMESVSEAAANDEGPGEWFAEHTGQLIAFALSFAIIAMFWMNHHRLFARVQRMSPALLWITVAWLFSIVWLPVATAMSGQMPSDDPVVIAVYIGSMLLTSTLSLTTRVYLRLHPALHAIDPASELRGIAVDLAMITLFAASLAVAVAVPQVSYFALLLMWLTGPMQRVFSRLLRWRASRHV